MDFKLLSGSERRVLKTWKFWRGGGVIINPLERKFPRGWGVKIKKTFRGGWGYGYFLELHNEFWTSFEIFIGMSLINNTVQYIFLE